MSKKKIAVIRLSALAGFTNAISALVPECVLNITEKKIYARAVDFANVGMVLAEAKLVSSNLEAKIGIDISAMKGALSHTLKTVPGDTLVRMQCRESKEPDRPYFELDFLGTEYRRTIQLKTPDRRTIRKEPNPPTIVLPVQVDVSGQELFNGVTLCAFYADAIRIATDQEGICTVAAKGEISQCRVEVARGAAGLAASLYSIDYLKDIVKALSGAQCILQFQTDHPMKIQGELEEGLTVAYLLAPRINEEEDAGEWL